MSELYNIVFTSFAETQIDYIINYLKENKSEQVANKVKQGIFDAIKGLVKMPHRHGILQLVSDEAITYRRVLKWAYIIVFHINENKKEVVIVDISHAKQDPQKLVSRLSD